MGPFGGWLGRGAAAASSVAAGALLAHLTGPPTPLPRAAPAPTTSTPVPATPPELALAAPGDGPPPADPAVFDPVRSDLGHGAVITGLTEQRIILLTFDDGPDPRYTRRLLALLAARDLHAVFFLSAERFAGPTGWARANREIVREIVAGGHVVASHGHRHIQFTQLTTPELVRELDDADQAFVDAIGVRPVLIRPPGGSRSPRTDAILAARGYTQVLWNLGTGDAQVRTADEVLDTFRRVLITREHETGSRGGVVLLHDIHEWSLEALPRILAHLERRNCALYEDGEELYDVIDDPAPFFEPRASESGPDAEARWARLDPSEHEARQARLYAETRERCERLALR